MLKNYILQCWWVNILSSLNCLYHDLTVYFCSNSPTSLPWWCFSDTLPHLARCVGQRCPSLKFWCISALTLPHLYPVLMVYFRHAGCAGAMCGGRDVPASHSGEHTVWSQPAQHCRWSGPEEVHVSNHLWLLCIRLLFHYYQDPDLFNCNRIKIKQVE